MPRKRLQKMLKVVIVGQAPRAMEHPADHEVWVINGPYFPPRFDRIFQLHGHEHIYAKHGAVFASTLNEYARTKKVYMPIRNLGLFRNATPFPIQELSKYYKYFTNSFALAIAFAILEGATEIILDGVMFSGGSPQWGAGEGWAVPCIEYWIGFAQGRGIKVSYPVGCGLFANSNFIYGFEGPGSI